MLSFRESKNVLWYTSESEELGRGSYGTVFRGIVKVSGDAVAVKVTHSNVTIPEEVEMREIEVCQRINHPNIVRLLGYEEERPTMHRKERPPKVLIMELCDGGSLFKILEHPKNHFGLEEDEFLTVLRDLTCGMKYLRENDIVHRDLKPANIMRCISDDGSSIYKITDFGAARELADNQEYSSIVGTEEYLHPDVYEQALLPESAVPLKKFSPSTDLWSIGATLYHVATGMLPFRPVGGRKNRKVMHLMTTKKESGVISAYQVKDKETIIFEKQLPKSCLLSPDLRRMICPLLGGLMEVDPRKKLTFESYFRQVEEILSKKQFHLFYFNKLQLVRLYVHPKEMKYADLTAHIERNTKVAQDDQILLFNNCALKSLFDNDVVCSKFPQTSETNPVVLCHRNDTDVRVDHEKILFKKKLFPNMIEYHKDAQIATHNCLVAYYINRQVHSVSTRVKLLQFAIQAIDQVVVSQLTTASKENVLTTKAVQSMRNQFDMMQCFHSLCTEFATRVPENVDQPGDNIPDGEASFHEGVRQLKKIYAAQFQEFQILNKALNQLKPSIDALLGSRVENRFLMNSWEEASAKTKGVADFLRIERISNTLVSGVDQSYCDFTGDLPATPQRKRTPLPEEHCLHLIERTKMIQTMDKLERQQTECFLNLASLTSVVSDWYKKAVTAYIQPEILANNIRHLQQRIEIAEEDLANTVSTFKLGLGKVTETFSAFPVVADSTQDRSNVRKSEKAKAVRDRLHELAKVQEEIQSKFKVNFELCDQLQGLLLTSFPEATS